MLLPILYNFNLLSKFEGDERFDYTINQGDSSDAFTIATKFVNDQISDKVNGQIYIVRVTSNHSSGEDVYYFLWLEKYGVGAPALYKSVVELSNEGTFQETDNHISRQDYLFLKTLPPFKEDDLDLAIAIYGVPFLNGRRNLGIKYFLSNNEDMREYMYSMFRKNLFIGYITGFDIYSKDLSDSVIIEVENFLPDMTRLSTEQVAPFETMETINANGDVGSKYRGTILVSGNKSCIVFRDYTSADREYYIAGDYDLALGIYTQYGIRFPELTKNAFMVGIHNKDKYSAENIIEIIEIAKSEIKTEEFIPTQTEEDIMFSAKRVREQEVLNQQMEEQEALLLSATQETETVETDKRTEVIIPKTSVTESEIEEAITSAEEKGDIGLIEVVKRKPLPIEKRLDATKEKEKISTSPSKDVAIPDDAYKIYSLYETCMLPESEGGLGYNKEVSREEFEAYFHAHPELKKISKELIGEFVFSEADLIERELLLYSPKTKKLVYKYEYLKGNSYELDEEFNIVKDEVVALYGEEFFNKQLLIINELKPEKYSLASIERVQYIHPLDENVVMLKLTSTKSIVFKESKKKEAKKSSPTESVDMDEEETLIEASIIIFFKEWLDSQRHRLAEFRLENILEVNYIYFEGMGFGRFKEYIEETAKSSKSKIEFTESSFVEKKDNVKRFVDSLYQDFLVNELEEKDMERIDFIWNKVYNGNIRTQIKKIPVFIRHSKYFKNYEKLSLDDVQVDGVKFAALSGSCILAHEVGLGKSLASIGFMSHLFETDQVHNIMLLVPKTLYTNKKWKEEAVGYTDEKGNHLFDKLSNGYKVGAIPMYNLIEVSNLTDTYVFNKGKEGGIKEYTDDEIDKINKYAQRTVELESATYRPKSFTMPPKKWRALLDELIDDDKTLYERFAKERFEKVIGEFIKSASSPDKDVFKLQEAIINIDFNSEWNKTWGDTLKFNPSLPEHKKEYDTFVKNKLKPFRSAKEKSEDGKMKRKELTEKEAKEAEKKKLASDKKTTDAFLTSELEETYDYVCGIVEKMRGYAIYEYGTFTFKKSKHNIILGTKEAIQNIGFGHEHIESVKDTVRNITEYKHETEKESLIGLSEELTIESKEGVTEIFKRKEGTVLQRQLEELINKLDGLLTEESDKPKFLISALEVDGFILDEAHIAKKIFTNVKTSKSVFVENPKGGKKPIRIPYSNYDIKGGTAPRTALRVFGICSYIHSLKNIDGTDKNSPVVLLTATPFTNQPTEVFSMLSLVGIKKLKNQGISNIKNFFDLFIKETLKYDYNYKGEFVKKIVVEDFRNKDKLNSLIWSMIDIQRGLSAQKGKPQKYVIPNFKAIEKRETKSIEDITTLVLEKATPNTSSILDMNTHQLTMQNDIERWLSDEKIKDETTGELRPIRFSDICPNFKLYVEAEDKSDTEDSSDDDEGTTDEAETVIVTATDIDAEKELGIKIHDSKSKESIRKFVEATKRDSGYGKVFKGLFVSKAICLSPYLFRCNDLPYPTAENLIKYSPKLEYLVKCLKSVKDWHESKGEEVSGQVVYMNLMKFRYLNHDTKEEEEFMMPELLKEYLVKEGIFKAEEIGIVGGGYGKREETVKKFQTGEIKVLFGSPAIREGVDLQNNSSTLYVLTPDWNPTDMRQIEGRIWRRGNKFSFVRIVYILMDDSVEVFIYAKLEEKSRRLQKLMKESNAITELEEMSIPPDDLKVALASEPKKRADLITKIQEFTTAEKLSGVLRDEALVNGIAGRIDIIFDKIESAVPVFKKYNTIKAEVSKKYNDFKLNELNARKIDKPKSFLPTYYTEEDLIVDKESVRVQFMDKLTNITSYYEPRGKKELGDYIRFHSDNKLLAEGFGVNKFTIDQLIIIRTVAFFLMNSAYSYATGTTILFEPTMPVKAMIEKAIDSIVDIRTKVIKETILSYYNTEAEWIKKDEYVLLSDEEIDALPVEEKINKILDMNNYINSLRGSMSRYSLEDQKLLKSGKYPKVTMVEVLARMGVMYTKDFTENTVSPIWSFRDKYITIYRSYLEPRGMGMEDLPSLMTELTSARFEHEKTLKDLETMKASLIERFTLEKAERKKTTVDDVVKAFSLTNSYLKYRF